MVKSPTTSQQSGQKPHHYDPIIQLPLGVHLIWHIPWIAIKNGEGVWIFMINMNVKNENIYIYIAVIRTIEHSHDANLERVEATKIIASIKESAGTSHQRRI